MSSAVSGSATVQIEGEDGIVRLIINRPDDGNGADVETLEALHRSLIRLADQSDVDALILTGAGADFCRGRIPPRREKAPTAMEVRSELEGIVNVNRALRDFPHPTIAAVEGRALGFGSGLAAHCDITIAAENARLGFPEILNNLPPLIVLSYLGRVVPRKIALDLVLTARTLSADDALRIGLVGEVVAPGTTGQRAREVAGALLERDPQAVLLARKFAREALQADEDTASEYGITMLAAYLSSRSR
jgi:enoyl-CoA hydratase/carnithine racemase